MYGLEEHISWFDIFQTSVLAAFTDVQSRAGNQKLWIGSNEHYFVYHHNFWPRDPYFAWFDYWLKGEGAEQLMPYGQDLTRPDPPSPP